MRSDEKQTGQRVPEPQAPQHRIQDPGRSTLSKSSKPAEASTKEPSKNFWNSINGVAAIVTILGFLLTILAFLGYPTLRSIFQHPDTITSIAARTSAPVLNKCGDVTSSNNTVGTTFCVYEGHKGPVRIVAWSPDGKRIASGGADGTVQVWDATTGGNVVIYRGHKGSVNAVAWSPNGQQIASGGADGTVQIWLSGDGSPVYTIPSAWECCGSVTAIAWSPDGQTLAVGTQDGDVNLFMGDSFALTSKPGGDKVHTGAVTALAFSPDGSNFASASSDGIRIGSNLINPYPGVDDSFLEINALAWSPDGRSIAYATFDGGSSGIGDVAVDGVIQRNVVTRIFDLHQFPIPNSLAWACNSKYLAVGEVTGHVDILDISSRRVVYSYTNHSKSVNTVAWSPGGTKIASGSDDGTVKVWQANTGASCNN